MNDGPQQDREVRLEQGTIRYREAGSGEPIVFVHGFLADGMLWAQVADGLGRDFRCIMPDWPLGSHRVAMDPGADLTPPGLAKLVAAFLEQLGLEQVTLVGNDSGGAISQLVVTRHPERVGRLVLTPCDAFENFPPRMFHYLQWAARSPTAFKALMQTMRLPGSSRLPISYGWLTRKPIDPALLRRWVGPILADVGVRRDAIAFLRGADPRYTLEAAAALRHFERPALLAWGTEDRFFPYEHAQRLAAILPHSRLEPVQGARTFVSLDQPGRVAELIAGFVREPAAAPA